MDKSENCVGQESAGVDLGAWLEANASDTGTTLGDLIKKALADGTKGALMEMSLAELATALSRSATGV